MSDQRKKETIAALDHGLEKILSLKTYSCNYITDDQGRKNLGFTMRGLQEDPP